MNRILINTYPVVPVNVNENIEHAELVYSKLNRCFSSIGIILKENLSVWHSCCEPDKINKQVKFLTEENAHHALFSVAPPTLRVREI